MKSSKAVKMGILVSSLSVLLLWTLYVLLYKMPIIERFPESEQQDEWLATLWHLPSIVPALIGLFIFRIPFPDNKTLYLYLGFFGLFVLCYGWSIMAPGAIAAGLPLLLLWTANIFLLFYIFDLLRKKPIAKG